MFPFFRRLVRDMKDDSREMKVGNRVKIETESELDEDDILYIIQNVKRQHLQDLINIVESNTNGNGNGEEERETESKNQELKLLNEKVTENDIRFVINTMVKEAKHDR